ncbi:MAG TPA: ABC transporter substrate-binding protein [Bradyrhizobium sp.]|nr:ABC transporter substrate-binding protein [Bradyrhizobium sp.]
MRRREFFGLVGSAATVWSLSAYAQQLDRVRKIAVLMNFAAEDAQGKARLQAFSQSLRKLGWVEGENLRTEVRWAGDNAERFHQYARELVGSAPDVILASASPSVAALQRVTRKVPIVFANVIDAVGAGFVTSLARPGGNSTGFTAFEYSISGKWLELLNELAPGLKRVAVVRDPLLAAGIGQFAAIQTMASASSTGVELSVIDPSDASGIERALAAFAHEPNGGVIVTASTLTAAYRDSIISSVNRYRLPAVYAFRYFTADGGLASYGPDTIVVFGRAAAYVDRILKGEKPADLPVQAPIKYELVINLRTAKAIGLNLPPALLARADEIIE